MIDGTRWSVGSIASDHCVDDGHGISGGVQKRREFFQTRVPTVTD
jgi:hypothetical protein